MIDLGRFPTVIFSCSSLQKKNILYEVNKGLLLAIFLVVQPTVFQILGCDCFSLRHHAHIFCAIIPILLEFVINLLISNSYDFQVKTSLESPLVNLTFRLREASADRIQTKSQPINQILNYCFKHSLGEFTLNITQLRIYLGLQ